MDRKLIGGSLILLTIQIYLLAADVNLFPNEDSHLNRKSNIEIGRITRTQQNVKRKNRGSIIWEDTRRDDILLTNDSILTLEDSTAQVKLKNEIQIELQENTLVVLEPIENDKLDSLRIRFSRGDLRSRSGNRTLQIGTETWSITAQPGSELNIKSLSNNNLEVELSQGSVELKNQNNPQNFQILSEPSKITLNQDSFKNVKIISDQLKFLNPEIQNVYSHVFPVSIQLRWTGDADQIRIIDSSKQIQFVSLQNDSKIKIHEYNFGAAEGNFYFSLVKNKDSSREILVRALRAPLIKYTSPLPRNRYASDKSILFHWLPIEGAKEYNLELTAEDSLRENYRTNDPLSEEIPNLTGLVHMRVFARDELGFKIPAFYTLPFYIVDNPLEAPKLIAPESRSPTSVKQNDHDPETKSHRTEKTPDQSANGRSGFFRSNSHLSIWWAQLFKLLLQKANATPQEAEVLFHWYPVNGADYYIIEISEGADFEKTLVNQKVSTPQFLWKNFKQGNYYWRVAGGTHEGRMGLFSEPTIAKLDRLDGKNNSEISPGIILVKSAPLNHQTDRLSPELTSDLELKKENFKNKELALTESNSNKVQPPSDFSAQELQPALFQYWAQANLSHNTYAFEKEYTANLKGFSNLSAAIGINFSTPFENTYETIIQYDQLNWKVEDKNLLPFQSNYSSQEYSIFAMRYWRNTYFKTGFGGETLTIFRRTDLEKLGFKEIFQGGPTAGYSLWITRGIQFNELGGLLIGNGITSVFSRSQFHYYFNGKTGGMKNNRDSNSNRFPYANTKNSFFLGGNFNFKIFFGRESLSGFYLKTGMHIGYNW